MAYNNRGDAYFKKGAPDKALADFNRAIRLNPKEELYRANKKITVDAINNARNAKKQEAENIRNTVDYYVSGGSEKYKSGDYGNAIVDWYKAISIDGNLEPKLIPSIAKAYERRGTQRAEAGDYGEALKDYDEALKLLPGNKSIIKARIQAKKTCRIRQKSRRRWK